jgi:hypothetical protein
MLRKLGHCFLILSCACGADAVVPRSKSRSHAPDLGPECRQALRWRRLRPEPEARMGPGAIYDAANRRMILFGAYRPTSVERLQDLWELSLNPGETPRWRTLSPEGTGPAWRQGFSTVYDSVNRQMVLFGGADATGLLNDTWALSLRPGHRPRWRALGTAGDAPEKRYRHSAIYDAENRRMIVFGGDAGGPTLRDIWTLTLGPGAAPTWTRQSPAGIGPELVLDGYAIYDAPNRRLLIRDMWSTDTWSLSLPANGTPAWSRLSVSGVPAPPGYFQSAIYDAAGQRMIVFGGAGPALFGDAWALSLPRSGTPTWTAITAGSTPSPRPRYLPHAVYDEANQRMVVFGGSEVRDSLNDLWTLSLPPGGPSLWTKVSDGEPGARHGHSAVYDVARRRMIVYGGRDTYDPSDVWALSLPQEGRPTWARVPVPLENVPYMHGPCARRAHAAVYDDANRRMVVFGGADTSTPITGFPYPRLNGEVWLWADGPRGGGWAQMQLGSPSPSARYGHAAVYDRANLRMIVAGGFSSDGQVLSDVWALSMPVGGRFEWTQLSPAGNGPTGGIYDVRAMYDHDHQRMILVRTATGDAWQLSLPSAGEPAWTRLVAWAPPRGPSSRVGASSIYDGDEERVILMGGHDPSDRNDVWELPLAEARPGWSPLRSMGPRPSPRADHAGLYDPLRRRMVVMGGSSLSAGDLADVWWTTLPRCHGRPPPGT